MAARLTPPRALPAAVRASMRELRAAGASFNAIAAALNRRGVPGKGGGRWFAASVRLCLLQEARGPKQESLFRSKPC
jgi:hypothetical protein